MSRPTPLLRFPRRDSGTLKTPAGDVGQLRPVTTADLRDPFAQKIGAKVGWVRLDITHADGLRQPPGFFVDRATAEDAFQLACAEDAKTRAQLAGEDA